MIIREHDCGTDKYISFSKQEAELQGENFLNLIRGRFLAEDVIDSRKTILLSKGELLDRENMTLLEKSNIEEIKIRTPLVCHSVSGVCQKCYGTDLSTRKVVEIGVPVGIIAAQSI